MLSIITVCYNAENDIEKTIKSVLNQSFNDFEYIVVDGNSKDNTNNIIKKYYKYFKKRGIELSHISEADKGIYDAMNKGINIADGEWLCFMNAGDIFYSEDVLEKIFSKSVGEADVIYGDVNNIEDSFEWIDKAKKIEYILEGMPFCHQSSFIKTDVIKKYMFDLNYHICADYDLFLKLYIKNYKFLKKDIVVSAFDTTGISNNGLFNHYFEKYKIQSKNGLINLSSMDIRYKLLKFKLHDFLKRCLPTCISKRIRRLKRRVQLLKST